MRSLAQGADRNSDILHVCALQTQLPLTAGCVIEKAVQKWRQPLEGRFEAACPSLVSLTDSSLQAVVEKCAHLT